MTQRVVKYTYGTGNPVLPDGSIDVRDGIDNLQSLDVFLGAEEDTYNQRDGKIVGTLAGANKRFDAHILNMGFTRIGTFSAGATMNNPRQTLLWDVADGGDGQEYGWSGTFPKVVPSASTPSSTGGISVGAWISRFDPELRAQVREALRRSYAEAGYNLVDGSFEVGGTLVNANDVLLHESSGKAFSGPAGHVAPGTDPVSGGFVDVSGMVFRKQIIDSNGSLNAKVTPVGEATQITVSEAVSPIVGQQRSRINYYSGQVVEAWVPSTLVTAGFRFAGNYHKGRSPSYGSGVNGRKLVSLINDLGAESSVKPNNWYALFACANDGDSSVTYKLMPFLRVGTVSGAKCGLTFAGMGADAHVITPTTYSWASDSLAGVDCLVITEGVDNRFSGRVDKIISNTAGSITLDKIGSVGAFDFILPSPPQFKNYVYLGSFYRDALEIANIADAGISAMFYGITLLDPAWPASGSVASPGVKLSFGGYISPLATGIIVFDNISISTSATSGDCATQYSHDSSNHVIGQHYVTKSSAPTISSASRMDLTFSTGQMCYMYTAGSLQASRVSGSLQILGWVEP